MRAKHRVGSAILVLAALALSGQGVGKSVALPQQVCEARVTWITDGDTITVRIDGKSERVRLVGIDTPEIKDDRREWRDLAFAASRYAREQLKRRSVTLESDAIQADRDDYGRLLRYVFLDGRDFNLELVRLGYAKVYRRFDFSRKVEFLAAEGEAREKKLGVWALPPGPSRLVH